MGGGELELGRIGFFGFPPAVVGRRSDGFHGLDVEGRIGWWWDGEDAFAEIVEFEEKLLYKVKPTAKLEKINSRWEFAISVGVRRRSGEVWIAVKGKVLRARSVRRILVEQRWWGGLHFMG